MSSFPNKKHLRKIFDSEDFKQELNSILLFVSEICDIPYAYIASIENELEILKNSIGLDFTTIPKNIQELNKNVIQQNKPYVVSNINKDSKISSDFSAAENFPIAFYAGFPLCIDTNSIVGIVSVMDTKPRELSDTQLKTLSHATKQIESLLNIYIKNKELQKIAKQKESQFQLFLDNSKEIVYEVNLDGKIEYVSKSWKNFLGHEVEEVIGKNNGDFIHPEDFDNCVAFLEKVAAGEKTDEEIVFRIKHKEGHYLWHASSLKLIQKEDGEPFYIGNCRDITEYIKARQEVLKQKQFYEKILDRLPTDVAVFNSNHKYIYLNRAAIKNDALRKFIIGKDDFEYANHTGRDDTFAKSRRERFNQALDSKDVIEWVDEIARQDHEIAYFTRKFAPIFSEIDESLEMMIGFGVDITDSKKIQEEILRSRQLTNSIIQNVAVGILVQGPNSEILENNKAACEMLGLTEDQLLGKTSFDPHWKVIHLDGSEFKSEEHPVPQAIKKLKPINNIVMGVHRPLLNDLVWLLVDAIPVFGNSGELLYVICSFNDITAQKNAEDDLKISNERFSYSSKATSDAIWDWNMITDKIYVGESYSSIFGHQFENNIITALECENFVHPEDRASYFEKIDKAIEGTDYKWFDEYRYLKSDGSYAYVNDKAIIIRNDEGKAIRMIGAMQDITTERKLKDQLQQSEEQFKGAFENSAVGMALVNTEGFYKEVNDRLSDMFGYSNQEMKSMTFQEITHDEDLEIDLDYKDQLDSGKISNFSSEKRFIHKNKSIVWVHMSVSLAKNNKNEIIHYIVQIIDISNRKKVEEENKLLVEENNRNKTIQLNEAKNMYRLLADNTIDLICLHNLDTSFQYVSPSVQRLLGYNPEELLGKSPIEYVHPDEIAILEKEFYDFINEYKEEAIELKFKTKEGSYILLEIKATIVKENGVTIGFQSHARDITQRKEAEDAIEKTLMQERELNELRTNLVSTISHEFRTPMTTIRTSAELITMYIEGHNFANSPQLQKRINIITEEIDRIVELMNAVLTISKEDSGKTSFNPVVLDVKQVCQEVIEANYNNDLQERKVTFSAEGDAFMVFADKNLIQYSLLNLLNNAFKYSEDLEDVYLNVISNRDEIEIQIIDFGIGIPEKDHPKLFNTFFRASNTNGIQGTGLGLYIVKTFTEKNSGTIQLESQLGKGTTVKLQFPLYKVK
jgi:PAS domain S-box-containing protein